MTNSAKVVTTATMVEQVARALLAVDYKDQIGEGDWLDMEWESKSHAYIAQARAAIEAMREPSEGVLDALSEAATLEGGPSHAGMAVWETGIDAILNETQAPPASLNEKE